LAFIGKGNVFPKLGNVFSKCPWLDWRPILMFMDNFFNFKFLFDNNFLSRLELIEKVTATNGNLKIFYKLDAIGYAEPITIIISLHATVSISATIDFKIVIFWKNDW